MFIPEHYNSVSNLTISDVSSSYYNLNSNTTAKHNHGEQATSQHHYKQPESFGNGEI